MSPRASLGTVNAAEKLQGLIDCSLAPRFLACWKLTPYCLSRSIRTSRCPAVVQAAALTSDKVGLSEYRSACPNCGKLLESLLDSRDCLERLDRRTACLWPEDKIPGKSSSLDVGVRTAQQWLAASAACIACWCNNMQLSCTLR